MAQGAILAHDQASSLAQSVAMHEMSLAEGVLQLVEDAARRENAIRVTVVVLEIGRLALVEPAALAFCFEAVCAGSVAEGARLVISEVPGAGWCAACADTVPMTELYAACPRCGAYTLQVSGGREMRVKEIEIE